MRNDLMRINPLHSLERASRFDRFLNHFFGDVDNANWADLRKNMAWNPSIDLEQSDNEITVRADIPGVKPDDLRVTVEDDLLTIEGNRKQEEKKEEGKTQYVERFSGSFSRSIQLPAHVDPDNIKAEYHDGVLHVTCPVEETAKAKQISVNAS
jgi:HSP20 family protein